MYISKSSGAGQLFIVGLIICVIPSESPYAAFLLPLAFRDVCSSVQSFGWLRSSAHWDKYGGDEGDQRCSFRSHGAHRANENCVSFTNLTRGCLADHGKYGMKVTTDYDQCNAPHVEGLRAMMAAGVHVFNFTEFLPFGDRFRLRNGIERVAQNQHPGYWPDRSGRPLLHQFTSFTRTFKVWMIHQKHTPPPKFLHVFVAALQKHWRVWICNPIEIDEYTLPGPRRVKEQEPNERSV